MKKLLMVALVVLVAVACNKGETPAPDKEIFLIYTAEDLFAFAEKVNGDNYGNNGIGSAQLDLDAKLMRDIDLEDRAWTPIGWYVYENEIETYYGYTGTFDGGDKSISGLNVDNANLGESGLFGAIYSNYSDQTSSGIIKNLTIFEPFINGNSTVGAVVADVYYGTIENCSVKGGSVTGSGNNIGGVAGYGTNATLIACSNSATVTGSNRFVGGIVGNGVDATLIGCYNTARVEGASEVGGVVGFGSGVELVGCYNIASVSGGEFKFGGLVGSRNGETKIEGSFWVDSDATDSVDEQFDELAIPLSDLNSTAVSTMNDAIEAHGSTIPYRYKTGDNSPILTTI